MLSFIEPTLLGKLRSERALPSPKGVRLTIMRMCAEENPDIAELAHLVQGDPALSGRIIRIVNLLNTNRVRPIAAVGIDTLLLVGLQAVRQLALALSLSEGGKPPDCPGFDYRAFWARSFAMGAAAQAIAAHTRVAPLAEMFTTGLLAGIGKLTLAWLRPGPYSSLLQRRLPAQAQLAMEQSLFGFNHLNLAAALMQDWQIPLLFCDAVLHHEQPMSSGIEPGSRQEEIIWTLNLADAAAGLAMTPHGEASAEAMAPMGMTLGRLGLPWNEFSALYQQAALDWQGWADSMRFGVSWSPLPADENAP